MGIHQCDTYKNHLYERFAGVILIMKGGGAYFFTASYHWGVIEMLWPHFSGVLMSSIFIYCLRSSYNAFYTLAHVCLKIRNPSMNCG